MKNLMHFFLFIFFIASCTNATEETQSESAQQQDTITTPIKAEAPAKHDSLLLTNSTAHFFSNTTTQDSFALRVSGRSIMEAQVLFTITNAEGVILHTETFPSLYLIDYGVRDNATPQEMEAYAIKRVNEFFAEKNFFKQAITPKDKLDSNYSDKAIWNDIKADPSAVGFFYKLGKEDGRRIAYSKKSGKVLRYFNCC